MPDDKTDLLAKIEMLKKGNKELLDKVDYYKHEYFAMCDLNEELQKEDKNAIRSPSFFIGAYYDKIRYNLVGKKIETIGFFSSYSGRSIVFNLEGEFVKADDVVLTLEELKAIFQKCAELKWFNGYCGDELFNEKTTKRMKKLQIFDVKEIISYLENELETTREKLIKETDRNRKLYEMHND